MASSNAIRVKGLTKKFGSFIALDDISFTVKRGEIVGFVGANGAGKTTTISTLLGFIHETRGDVQVLGHTVRPQNAHKTHNNIGYAAGDMELPPRLTGKQYLSFIMHHSEGDHREYYEELCRLFQPELNKKIRELSRGNRQKIALIGAFVTDPDLIILDEPTSGLDPVMQKVFLDLILGARIQKKTIFMSSHYLEEVAQVCSRVILMRNGKIIQDIEAEKLLESSGKQVHIITKYKNTRAPKDAVNVKSKNTKKGTALSFVFKGDMSELQRWLASLKQLEDIEVSEYDLSGAFSSLYEDEEEIKK
jgi:ABC-2 type transport system ATP-binding protein